MSPTASTWPRAVCLTPAHAGWRPASRWALAWCFHCFEFRIVVESGAAALAASKATHAEVVAIEHQLRQLDVVIAEQTLGAREDFDFHLAIARASHNPFFTSSVALIQEQVLVSMNLMRNLSLLKSIERQHLVQAEHAAIVAALRRHDAPAAGQAMREHLENARDRMFGA